MVNQQMPPNFDPSQPVVLPKASKGGLIFGIVMSFLFVCALGLAIWAFIGMTDAQSNLDQKIEAANAVAVEEANEIKEAEFAEREKDPFVSYSTPATFGSLTFEYPKNWSGFVDTEAGSTPIDFYAHPRIIPGFDDTNFALRVQVEDRGYVDELSQFDSLVDRGEVRVRAFRLPSVPEALGSIITGEIDNDKTGTLVLLPQRDKTIKIFTESDDYTDDFAKILESTTFNP